MKIDISGRHFHVTEPLKRYATEKILKLDKYGLKLESAHVIMEVEKFRHLAEIIVLGKNLRTAATAESVDMYAAFDKCFGNLQLQLARQHEKVKDHKARRYKEKTKKEI